MYCTVVEWLPLLPHIKMVQILAGLFLCGVCILSRFKCAVTIKFILIKPHKLIFYGASDDPQFLLLCWKTTSNAVNDMINIHFLLFVSIMSKGYVISNRLELHPFFFYRSGDPGKNQTVQRSKTLSPQRSPICLGCCSNYRSTFCCFQQKPTVVLLFSVEFSVFY